MSGRVIFSLTTSQAAELVLLDALVGVPYTPSQSQSKVLGGLERRGLVERCQDGWRLTPSGDAARLLVARLASTQPRAVPS